LGLAGLWDRSAIAVVLKSREHQQTSRKRAERLAGPKRKK
jgi:hypothetical protein